MKKLYSIGIAVAVILIVTLSLLKFGQVSNTGSGSETAALDSEQPSALPTEVSQHSMATDTDSAATVPQENTTVVLKTNKGDITIELYTKDMPITAGNFLKLARENFYDGVKFHRVIDGFMIQGGDPLTKDDSQVAHWGTGGPGYAIPDEFGPHYSNVRGTISMANAGPNTGGSQFFINTADNTFLDGKHPVFGRVTAGTDVVDTIAKMKTGTRDIPVEPIVIEDVAVEG